MKRAFWVMTFCLLGTAAAQAATVSYSCPTVFGDDVLVADFDARLAQVVGDRLVRYSPNYGIMLEAFTNAGRWSIVAPTVPVGGGPVLPGYEFFALRLEANGNLIAEEYARETVLGACTPITPIAFQEPSLPSPSPTEPVSVLCTAYNTSGPDVAAWAPIEGSEYMLTFDPASSTVLKQGAGAGESSTLGVWYADAGHKITFSEEASRDNSGYSLNRYSGFLFQTSNLGYSPGRMIANCVAE